MHSTLSAGACFPEITLPTLSDGEVTLGSRGEGEWALVVVYRGQHCPLCTKYLKQLTLLHPAFGEAKVGVVAVSGDSEAQARSQMDEVKPSFPVAYGLDVEGMRALGCYISDPRSDKETDHPFAEPALFVVNGEGAVQIADISNAPFARPDLEALLSGVKFVRANDYPIRGMHTD